MTRVSLLAILVFIFGCRQQQAKNETSVASTPDSLKAENASPMSRSAGQINESETVTSNGHNLLFQPTDSVAMTDIFGDGDLRKQMTDTLDNSHQRYILIEKYLADRFKNYFTATDSILIIFLEDNRQLKFPKWDKEKDEGYNFEHYFSSIDYFLLHVQWGEGNDWMLVNRKNGFKKRIIGEPYISPDVKRILAVNSTMPGYGDNGIELLSISGDTLKTEFKFDLGSLGATRAKWLSNNKVIIEKEYVDEVNSRKTYTVLTID